MQIKLIYTKKGFLHLALFWKWKFWKLPIEMLPKALRINDNNSDCSILCS